MELIPDDVLEESAVVANCTMNRQRSLRGSNGYDVELRFDPMDYVVQASEHAPVRWLDLCCGSAMALGEAATIIAEKNLPVEIVGLDLVGMFAVPSNGNLTLITASLNDWEPDEPFDLITCVHGLHYLGDKLGVLASIRSWLKKRGRFAANLDMGNIKVVGRKTSRAVSRWLRETGFDISTQHKLITCNSGGNKPSPFEYLGADDQAGPNYTGQPVVDSHYRIKDL